MDLTPHEKRFLTALGRREDGRDLVAILKRAKESYSSITSIDPKGDYGAQVEGRKIFITFIDEMISNIMTQPKTPRPIDRDDFE